MDTVTKQIEDAIAEQKGNIRDALNVALGRLDIEHTLLIDANKENTVLHTHLDELDKIERIIMTRSEYNDGQLSDAEVVQDAFKRIEAMADHYSQDLQTTISEIESENTVLRDRLNAIHATAEELHLIIFGEAWTETDVDRIEYILEQADLTVKEPFSKPKPPEVQTFIDNLGGDHGNP